MSYVGKVRLICSKVDVKYIEIYDYSIFDDQLITDVDSSTSKECLQHLINDCGLEYAFEEDILEILKKYEEASVVEIVADAYIEDTSGMTECGMEYDYNSYLENTKHRQLNSEQIIRFCQLPEEDEEAEILFKK